MDQQENFDIRNDRQTDMIYHIFFASLKIIKKPKLQNLLVNFASTNYQLAILNVYLIYTKYVLCFILFRFSKKVNHSGKWTNKEDLLLVIAVFRD